MMRRREFLAGTMGTLASSALAHAGAPNTPLRPNFLIFIADDLGFSDLGCYGGDIYTPCLDRLAAGGLRFTQFYNTARCWSSRASILSGYYAQHVRGDTAPGRRRGQLPDWAPLLPSMLQPLGYRSYHSGKWHVVGTPQAGGFDQSYGDELEPSTFPSSMAFRRGIPSITSGHRA